jgi:hypothetical protein
MPLFAMVIVNMIVCVFSVRNMKLSEEGSAVVHDNEVFKKAKLIISYVIIMYVDVAVTQDLCIICDTEVSRSPLSTLRGILKR